MFVSDAGEQKACHLNPNKQSVVFFLSCLEFWTVRKYWGSRGKKGEVKKPSETLLPLWNNKVDVTQWKVTEFHDKLKWQKNNQRKGSEEIRLYEKYHCVRGWEEEEGFIPTGFSSQSSSSPLLHTHTHAHSNENIIATSPCGSRDDWTEYLAAYWSMITHRKTHS